MRSVMCNTPFGFTVLGILMDRSRVGVVHSQRLACVMCQQKHRIFEKGTQIVLALYLSVAELRFCHSLPWRSALPLPLPSCDLYISTVFAMAGMQPLNPKTKTTPDQHVLMLSSSLPCTASHRTLLQSLGNRCSSRSSARANQLT